MTPRSAITSTARAALRLVAVALACAGALLLPAAGSALGASARVTVKSVVVSHSVVTISGRVALPAGAGSLARRTVLYLTLSAAPAPAERFTAKAWRSGRFLVAHRTHLSGRLALSITVRVAGRASGRRLLRSVFVAPSSSTAPGAGGGVPGAGDGSGPGTGKGSETPGSTAPPVCPSAPGTVLSGTFKLATGGYSAGAPTGSWFEMLIPGKSPVPLENGNSPLANKAYTPLSGGTDGGLSTVSYQAAPSPPFDGLKEGKEVGNSLAARLIAPQNFFSYNFGIVTQASDPQSGEATAIPRITDTGGALSGQLSAWDVGWNGQWFNQGTPKPNGGLPGGTTALSGACDAATGHYSLDWRSLIVGGPFNGFLGVWHLEGTFVPAS